MNHKMPNNLILPDGWTWARLGDLTREFLNGGTPSTKKSEYWDGAIHWTTSAPIAKDALFLNRGERFITQEGLANSSTHLIPKGNLLIGTRVGVGKAVVNTIDVAISQDLTGAVLDLSKVDAEFIALQYKSNDVQSFINRRKRGVTIQGITRSDLESLEFPLPPLPEQRAIAHTLRTVQNARAARQRELVLERERKAALMEHLFTHGTRGEPRKQTEIGEIPESWEIVKLDEVLESRLGKMLSGVSRRGISPRYYLRNANVQWGQVDLNDLAQMDFDEGERETFRLNVGDIIVCEGGEIGRTAIWRGEIHECYFQKAIHRLRPRDGRIHNEFFMYHMMNAFLLHDTYGLPATATTIAHLPGVKLKALRIPLPAIQEQHEISKILRASELKISALEREAALLDELFRALLEELMTGRVRAV